MCHPPVQMKKKKMWIVRSTSMLQLTVWSVLPTSWDEEKLQIFRPTFMIHKYWLHVILCYWWRPKKLSFMISSFLTELDIQFSYFPGKDLCKVTTDSSILNNNSLSNGKRYKSSFNWDVRKIIDKKAQANKCPSLLQFPGKDLPKVTTGS